MVVKLESKRWKYFSEEELRCKGTGELKMMEEFMAKLILLREKVNQPLVISSGYRTPEYNKRIGGSSKSAHILGQAVDIVCSGTKAHTILMHALELGFTGIGVKQHGDHKSRFIHLDTVKTGVEGIPRPWVWSYK
tara:strand:- start:198 stop:602 length:405 start_codon:yes stop_codon:yes gene_type:complete